jgi:hypothetical protein
LLDPALLNPLSTCANKPQPAVCEECLRRAQGKAQTLVAR